MTKEKAMMIQNRINNGSHNAYEETSIVAKIIENGENYYIEVKNKDRNLTTFHHIDVIGAITVCFEVQSYATITDENNVGILLF